MHPQIPHFLRPCQPVHCQLSHDPARHESILRWSTQVDERSNPAMKTCVRIAERLQLSKKLQPIQLLSRNGLRKKDDDDGHGHGHGHGHGNGNGNGNGISRRSRSHDRAPRHQKKLPIHFAVWTSECSWRASIAPAGWTSPGLRAIHQVVVTTDASGGHGGDTNRSN